MSRDDDKFNNFKSNTEAWRIYLVSLRASASFENVNASVSWSNVTPNVEAECQAPWASACAACRLTVCVVSVAGLESSSRSTDTATRTPSKNNKNVRDFKRHTQLLLINLQLKQNDVSGWYLF